MAVAESTSARYGTSIDTIGHANPRTDPIEQAWDEAKAKDWLSKGAQPSDTVVCLAGDGSLVMTCQELATAVRHTECQLLGNHGAGVELPPESVLGDGDRVE